MPFFFRRALSYEKSPSSLESGNAIDKRRMVAIPARIEPVGHRESKVVAVEFDERRSEVGGVGESGGVQVRLVLVSLGDRYSRLLRHLHARRPDV